MKASQLKTTQGIEVAGPLLLEPKLYADERGFFMESWNQDVFLHILSQHHQPHPINFIQDNHSSSRRGVLRGLHYQLNPKAQAKLVRCVRGAIYDVAVDLRFQSPTFGQWVAAELSETNHHQLWIPEGFAHGFITLSDVAVVLYKTNHYWDRTLERSIRWDDPDLAIHWERSGQPITPLLSDKDAQASLWSQLSQDDFF
jgi:dTDP-4-dehydrorhamnose 3,5-epimerase